MAKVKIIQAWHSRLHSIISTLDHTSGATPGQMLKADANGLPIDAGNTNAQVVAAVALAHDEAASIKWAFLLGG